MTASALPWWLLHPGPVLLRRHVRNKGDPLCDPVELVEGNQDVFCDTSRWWPRKHYFCVWLRAFSQVSSNCRRAHNRRRLESHDPSGVDSVLPNCPGDPPPAAESPGLTSQSPSTDSFPSPPCADVPPLRRSTRLRKPPDRFGDLVRIISKGGEWRFRCQRLPALISPLIDYVPRWIALLCLVVSIARRCQIISSFVPGGCCVALQMLRRAGVLSWIKPGERFRSSLGSVVTSINKAVSRKVFDSCNTRLP